MDEDYDDDNHSNSNNGYYSKDTFNDATDGQLGDLRDEGWTSIGRD